MRNKEFKGWGQPAPQVPPSVVSTVVLTVLFGVFGAIPAAINASKARKLGASVAPYWTAYGVTMLVWLFVIVTLSSH